MSDEQSKTAPEKAAAPKAAAPKKAAPKKAEVSAHALWAHASAIEAQMGVTTTAFAAFADDFIAQTKAKTKPEARGVRFSLFGISSTSTAGLRAAMFNWANAARRRANEIEDG